MVRGMETLHISDFKTHAIAVLKEVKKTGRPVLITIRGEPVAEIVPPPADRKRGIRLGTGRHLTAGRPTDQALVTMDFGKEWEIGA